jgi:hypothetical protein
VAFISLPKGFGRAARTHLFRLIKREKTLRAPRPLQLCSSIPHANIKKGKINSEKSFALVSGNWAAHMAGE